ncbi:MAG: hypothetical protein ACXVIJ_13220 [Thermoanaerobaculia bacterium]
MTITPRIGEADSNNDSIRTAPAGFFISAADRELVRRMTVGLLFLVIFVTAFARLELMYSHKFFDSTGRAEWIWARREISRGTPLAFFATRDFDLPANRYFTQIKIAGDPEYTLYFNGKVIGGRRMTDENRHLDVYDVTPLARVKANRIVVAVRSSNGVGGLIVSVDIAPENRNVIVTDGAWKAIDSWAPDLPLRGSGPGERPVLIGRPPIGKWNYLLPASIDPLPEVKRVVSPRSSFAFKTAVPEIVFPGGVAIVKARPMRATAFDFGGPTAGRLRLHLNYDPQASYVVFVRFSNLQKELGAIDDNVESFVFAPHEPVVIDETKRMFRYAAVYGPIGEATADVVE